MFPNQKVRLNFHKNYTHQIVSVKSLYLKTGETNIFTGQSTNY